MKNFTLFFVLMLTMASTSLLGQNGIKVIHFDEEMPRQVFSPDDLDQKVRICGLNKKNDYSIAVHFKDCSRLISPVGANDFQQIMTFEPSQTCEDFDLQLNCLADFYITIQKMGEAEGVESLEKSMMLNIQTGAAPQTMIQDVLVGGGCFDLTNVSYTGSFNQRGTFTGGLGAIGFDEGIVLSSGFANNANGPNNNGGSSAAEGSGPDPDLTQIIGGIGGGNSTNDAAVLEFDFVPTLNTLTFDFAFGSEEYCEWIGQFNDVFGFFLSGPGINGPYANNAINLAVIPGTNTPVTINSINNASNPAFFIQNDPSCGGYTNQALNGMDGYTTVMTATANLIPCETYHIKLAIADDSDQAFDSFVFLSANSFDIGGDFEIDSEVPLTGTQDGYEGCTDGCFIFTREPNNISQPLQINYSVSGSATPGSDYSPLPPFVVIPAGQTQVKIPVTMFSDNIAEGIENIEVTLDNPCSCSSGTSELFILENTPMTASVNDIEICGGLPGTLTSSVSGGVEPYSYQWNNGFPFPNLTDAPTENTTYTLTVTDLCGQMTQASGDIDVVFLEAEISGQASLCNSNSSEFLTVEFNGLGPTWDFVYTIDGMNPMAINTNQNPYQLEINQPGVYELTFVQSEGCPGMGTGMVTVSGSDLMVDGGFTDVTCFGQNDGTINVDATGSSGYNYDWSDANIGNDSSPNGLSPGVYTVTVSDVEGCETTYEATIEQPTEITSNVISVTGVDCVNPTGGAIDIDASGGAGSLSYNWNNGAMTQDVTGLTAGEYEVIISDGPNCSITQMVTVPGDTSIPMATIDSSTDINCDNTIATINAGSSSSGANITYTWVTPDGNITLENGTSIEADAAGTYTLTVTNTDNNCFSSASETIEIDNVFPVVDLDDPNNITCVTLSSQLDASGSSGNNLAYSWTVLNGTGTFTTGTNIANPSVNGPGEYQVEVTNQDNGCSELGTVIVIEDIANPIASAGVDTVLNCATTELDLDGSASSMGNNFTYEWTTGDGSFTGATNIFDPEINAGGTYNLTVTNLLNGCTEMDEVFVTDEGTLPTVSILTPDEITCDSTSVILDASTSSTGGSFSYNWTAANGGFVSSGQGTLNPTAASAGDYTLTIINNDNGCEEDETVTIVANNVSPIADGGMAPTLSCLSPILMLDGTGSSTGPNITYTWTATVNGNIVSGENTTTPTIDAPGTYELIVSNTENGCLGATLVEVEGDAATPIAMTAAPAALNCLDTLININGAGSSLGASFTYAWAYEGSPIADADALFLDVNQAGDYTLLVTNVDNNCVDSTTVTILSDTQNPIADAGLTIDLTCTNAQVNLDGAGSSTGAQFIYEWTSTDGNIISGNTAVDPLVDSIGTYIITVTDINNNCTSESMVTVGQNTTDPTVEAGDIDELTCSITELNLDGTQSSAGPEFEYVWTASNGGNISMGGDSANPLIDAAGTYTLEITNTDNGCVETDEVIILEDVIHPTADAGATFELTCANIQAPLAGMNSSQGAEFSYEWSTINGNINGDLTMANSTADMAGDYQLIVLNTDNNCSDTAFVNITQDITEPDANAGTTFTLDCVTLETDLDANNGTSIGTNFEYAWTTVGGNFVDGQTTLEPTINAAGTYTLTVINTDNGCENTSEVIIEQADDAPTAFVAEAASLTCVTDEIQLDASTSTTGMNISFEWTITSPSGNIVMGDNTYEPTVDEPGTYLLTILNMDNNCTSFSSVTIEEDVLDPAAQLTVDEDITCTNEELVINGTGTDSGANFQINWNTLDGNISANGTTANPTVDLPGTYTMTILNIDNGCDNTETVVVMEDTTDPTLMIETPDVLTCELEQFALDASNSSTGGTFTYLWTTTDGTISSGADSAMPTIEDEGTYTLLITNTVNGCTTMDAVIVTENVDFPTAEAGSANDITCQDLMVSLDGSDSDAGTNISYVWTVIAGSGNISDPLAINPLIDAPGTYLLTVTNMDNNCISMDEVIVGEDIDLPTLQGAANGDITCLINEATINTQGSDAGTNFQYSWNALTGNIIDETNPALITVGAAGTYELTILNTLNGCDDAITITVEEDQDLPTVEAGETFTLNCNDPETTLTGSSSAGSPSYSWEATNGGAIISGGTSANPSINAAGTYILTVVNNDNGCENSDEIDVISISPETFETSAVPPTCIDGTGTIEFTSVVGGTEPYAYSIDGGASYTPQAIFSNVAPGNYEVMIIDANDCELADDEFVAQGLEITIDIPDSLGVFYIDLGEDVEINTQVNIDESLIESIQWTPFTYLSDSSSLTPISINPLSTITYELQIETIDGCDAEARTTIQVNRDFEIYVPTAFSPDGTGDSRNEVVFIQAKPETVAVVKSFYIYNRWGEAVHQYFEFQANDPNFGWDGFHKGQLMDPAVFTWMAEVEFLDGRTEIFQGDVSLIK